MDELAQKVEFDGPSVNISSKNLALGVLALDSRLFNGTSFSAFFPPNSSDPMVTVMEAQSAQEEPVLLLNPLPKCSFLFLISKMLFCFLSYKSTY